MSEAGLSRRERQILDIIYQRGRATAAEVVDQLLDPPSYSSVRALLRVLEGKGHVRHTKKGARYVYLATRPRRQAARSALERVVRTFYGGSLEGAMAGLLEVADTELDDSELKRLADLIEKTREERR